MCRVLIVEENADLREMLSFILNEQRYTVRTVDDGCRALDEAAAFRPDLILLDADISGCGDGYQLCRRLKSDTRVGTAIVVMMAALDTEEAITNAFHALADDYVAKPLAVKALLARLEARLRGAAKAPVSSVVAVGPLEMDTASCSVSVAGEPVRLRHAEYELLLLLARRPNIVFSRDRIIAALRGDDYAITERVIDKHIHLLRKKLGVAGDIIETVNGFGYRLKG